MSSIEPENYFDKFQQPQKQGEPSTLIPSRQAWLRKWEILVYPRAGGTPILLTSSEFGISALRATFDIYKAAFTSWWSAEIEIYNLDAKTTETVLTTDLGVIVNAGYENAQFGEIFHGRILQPTWERENVNFKTTLNCVLPGNDKIFNYINKAYGAFVGQRDIITHIAQSSMTQLTSKSINGIDNTVKLPRGQVYFGHPEHFLAQIAAANSTWMFTEDDGFSIGTADSSINPADANQAITYSPKTGIIGTPIGTKDGVTFRVLLDNRLLIKVPYQPVKIDNSSIRVWKEEIGEPRTILDEDGIYYVRALRHVGDTRGQNWYTDITGTVTAAAKLKMMSKSP